MRNIAYLMNTYPLISTTFIRREIEAHERAGVPVRRYALRQWDGELVDPADIAEIDRTHYILSGNIGGLLTALLKEIFTNPGGLIKALPAWWSLYRGARGDFIPHAAYLLEAIYFRQQAKRDGIDHVHVHFLTNSTAVAMLARLMGGPAYSSTVHGPDELSAAPLLDFSTKIEHAKFIAAITSYCKSQLIRFSSPRFSEKIKIIHCALKMDEFEPSPPPDNQTLICIGRLCPQKGQTQIPAALAEVLPEFPEMKVILIGDGEARKEVEVEIAKHGVSAAVEIAGWIPNEKVRAMMKEGRALLLPSYAEGLPVVIMEAFALGRPVISTYIAGIPELVDDVCGWIIPAGDHDALVGAMRGALRATPEALAAKGAEGRRRVERAHDIDTEAAKLRALFEEAVAANP